MDVLAKLEASSASAVVTDPQYGIGLRASPARRYGDQRAV
jgi:hypothetical protein